MGRQTGKQADRLTVRQTDGQNRQTDRYNVDIDSTLFPPHLKNMTTDVPGVKVVLGFVAQN